MDYYSPFWGLVAIFMVAEAQGALMCHSSTLAISADSGPFSWAITYCFGVLVRFPWFFTTRNMSTSDLLLVTLAELVVNPRPFRLEGLKP